MKTPREIILKLAQNYFNEGNVTADEIKKMTGFKTKTQQRYYYRVLAKLYGNDKKLQGWKK